jgi:site-specific DNA-methyltransferase (adenine-specific)
MAIEPAVQPGPSSRATRSDDFSRVADCLARFAALRTAKGIVAHGDSLKILAEIPDDCISLIVTDPPYHSTKKANITGDRDFQHDDEYLDWMARYAQEWHRILRPNGSLYVFCATEMSARLEQRIGAFLKPLSHITWTKPNDPGFDGWKGKMKKEALRRYYPHSERILFFEQAAPGHVRRSTLGAFLYEARKAAGLTANQLTEEIGAYNKVNNGGAVSNWETGRNIPSRQQWARIAEALEATGKVCELPPYEDLVRPFHISREVEFTDVWDFPSVRMFRGKHPAEKPVDLLTHIIETSSYEEDLVLDCFAGSGSVLKAAVTVNRHCIGIESDERWVRRCASRLVRAEDVVGVTTERQFEARRLRKEEHRVRDGTLF